MNREPQHISEILAECLGILEEKKKIHEDRNQNPSQSGIFNLKIQLVGADTQTLEKR